MKRRIALLYRGFQRHHLLTMRHPAYRRAVKRFTLDSLVDDLGREGDLTSRLILRSNHPVQAEIVAKAEGVLAGLEEVCWFYRQVQLGARPLKKDGNRLGKGEVFLVVGGRERSITETERTALNLLQRMSGIATLTRQLVDLVHPINRELLITSLRKTPWGLLDKKAVCVGGGGTHRLGLWEAILIKDNHLQALRLEGVGQPLEEALQRAWQARDRATFIEIEVTSQEEAIAAARILKQVRGHHPYPCFIMLDNMPPATIAQLVERLHRQGLYDDLLLEASGGINPDNIANYARCGVDAVSIGYLTHSPKALDLSLEITTRGPSQPQKQGAIVKPSQGT